MQDGRGSRFGKEVQKSQEVDFKWVVREDLTEKVVFEPSHEGGRESGDVGKSIPGSGNSLHKGSEVKTSRVAGAE